MTAELRAYNPSWRDRVAQFFIGDEKPSEMKRRAVLAAFGSTGLGNEGISLSDATPLGMVFSGNDAVRSAQNGHYGEAALNALGAVPSGIITGATLKAIKGIKQGENLASKGTFIHNAPEVKPRPFELDYPNGAPADATGKLTHDIDGRELTAKYVAGRKTVGGSDTAIPTEEYDALAEAATGRRPQAVASRQIGGDAGQYVVTTDRRSGNVIDREIFIDKALPPHKAENVLAHEIGHAIDEISGKMPIDGLNQELRTVYNGQNNPQSYGKLFGPENAGYRTKDEVRKELVGEAIRAYKQNANYIKTVAPNTAARIREFVNSHPTLKHIIQFNSIAAIGGAGATAMMPDDAKAAPVQNLLTSFMDQRETIGNLLAPFLTGQPQQFAKQPNPNMLLQGAEAAQSALSSGKPNGAGVIGELRQGSDGRNYQYAETTGMLGDRSGAGWIETNMKSGQPAPQLSAPSEVLQQQVAQVPRAVDPMPTAAIQQKTPQQPPQSKSGGFFDGLSKFGESDFGQRLGDMMLGWGMGGTVQDSLSKGSQMIAAGNQDRKAKKEQFSTAEWLKKQGMDEEEAKYVAGNSQALNAYLIALRKGVDPMQALQQRKMELEINKLENPQLSPSDQLAREKFEWEKRNGDGSTEYGLNPIWGQDDQGKPVLGVLGKNGSFKQVETGGFDISSGTEQIDLGDSFAIKDKRSGQIIGTVPKNLANAEREKVLGKASGERETSAEGDFTTAQNALDLIDDIRNDPYRERGTGASSVLNNVWGTGGYDFSEKVEQAKSGAFLTAIQQMKGLGALSNNEGAAATAAVTRMNTAMSEQGFLDALADYEKIVKQGMERARKNLPQGAGASPASSTVDFSDYFKQ